MRLNQECGVIDECDPGVLDSFLRFYSRFLVVIFPRTTLAVGQPLQQGAQSFRFYISRVDEFLSGEVIRWRAMISWGGKQMPNELKSQDDANWNQEEVDHYGM